MKLVVVTALKENSEVVQSIFQQANIKIFSATDTQGVKNSSPSNLLDSWFSGNNPSIFDSVFLFSFTTIAQAKKTIELIDQYNENESSEYPIRAFVMPVEYSSK